MLTQHQKDSIIALRYQGQSYQLIANNLDLSINTVKSFCYRSNISSTRQNNTDIGKRCINCGVMLVQTPGAKQKTFCSDKCRYAWWNRHKSKQPCQLSCQFCGKGFISFGNRNRKFCGRECYLRSRYGGGLP